MRVLKSLFRCRLPRSRG